LLAKSNGAQKVELLLVFREFIRAFLVLVRHYPIGFLAAALLPPDPLLLLLLLPALLRRRWRRHKRSIR
jgi:hypothetical protein